MSQILYEIDWSAVAAWVALAGTTYTWFRGRKDRKVDAASGARNELLEVMVKLGEVRKQLIEHASKPSGDIYNDRILTGHLRDTREVLALRARDLLSEIPELQYSTVYIALGLAFEESNELGYGEEMVRLAVKSARTSLDRGAANRSLSRFEFRNGNISAGRTAMGRALDAYSANDPRTVFERVGSLLELAEFEVIYANDPDLGVSAWHRAGHITKQYWAVGSENHTKLAEQAHYVRGLLLKKYPRRFKVIQPEPGSPDGLLPQIDTTGFR